ncbi:MAG: hypothetical protein DRR06_19515 [Gammaproteobacteria bacterium]|nr:MAG: hypothetical protein DRR06_19515 [Gammaproteobacteria bacterium]
MTISRLRNIAATLLTVSGISHIASLWIRDIDLAALVNASFGAVYLFIGIGLYGQSRFALFTAIIFPGMGAGLALKTYELSSFSTLGISQLGVGFIVIAISIVVLFAVRNNPSI